MTHVIYSATYSNIPVLEMIVNAIPVMRRRSDSYLNATQILKVAGIEKGKRTKILEREVLISQHEKVQGGYGKYQGTWIPCDKGRELAERYNVLEPILPLIQFVIPKPNSDGDDGIPTKEQAMAAMRRLRPETFQLTPFSSQASPPSSPFYSTSSPAASSPVYIPPLQPSEEPNRKKIKLEIRPDEHERLRGQLSSTFLLDDVECIVQILPMLQNPRISNDIIFNLVLDEKGNTILHFAATLAYVKTIEELIAKGANTCRGNNDGETALMLSVKTNKYDKRSFQKLLSVLGSSIHVADKSKRTVLHHIVLHKGVNSPRYMEQTLNTLRDQSNFANILHHTDHDKKTAFDIAKSLNRLAVANLLEEAEARISFEEDQLMWEVSEVSTPSTPGAAMDKRGERFESEQRTYPPSQYGRDLTSVVQRMVDALDADYHSQLSARDGELQRTRDELSRVTQQLEDVRRRYDMRRTAESEKLREAQHRIRILEQKSEKSYWSDLGLDSRVLQDMDSLLCVDDKTTARESRLQDAVRYLLARGKEQNTVEDRLIEKELQCKRLIAACCSLPLEKVDDLIEPLTLAIESDPPDLDLSRVIGFMESIRRQGTAQGSGSNGSGGGDGSKPGMPA